MILYGTFEEKGYSFEAYIPNSDDEPIAFNLRILCEGDLKYALLIPLLHTPTFGVDVSDMQHLEATLEKVLILLPDAQHFSATDVQALETFEEEIGGKWSREKIKQRQNSAVEIQGQFEYTAELFANKFSELLGGRRNMALWMSTNAPQLGDRTPEEALRLGMFQNVMRYLVQVAEQSS